jgi:hypothetical protein
LFQFGVIYPVDAVHRAGIDGFLNYILRVAILPVHSGPTIVRLNIKSIAGNVGTVLAANAGDLIHIHTLLAQLTAQFRFKAGTNVLLTQLSTQFRL